MFDRVLFWRDINFLNIKNYLLEGMVVLKSFGFILKGYRDYIKKIYVRLVIIIWIFYIE